MHRQPHVIMALLPRVCNKTYSIAGIALALPITRQSSQKAAKPRARRILHEFLNK
jgi:hypothetical protein